MLEILMCFFGWLFAVLHAIEEWWLNQSEDESAVGQRIDTLLEEVRSLPSGASAILVTHSQLIRCFFKRLRQLE
eukprot:4405687-Amphidinium_carterae.1